MLPVMTQAFPIVRPVRSACTLSVEVENRVPDPRGNAVVAVSQDALVRQARRLSRRSQLHVSEILLVCHVSVSSPMVSLPAGRAARAVR